MIIQYTKKLGPRLVNDLVWKQENGFLQDVTDANVVLTLILHPPNDFAVDQSDPLAQLVGMDVAALLAIEGIISPADLAGVRPGEVKALAQQIGVSSKQLLGWIKEAT